MALDIDMHVYVPVENYQNYSDNYAINKGMQPYLKIQKDNVKISYMNASNNSCSSFPGCIAICHV